MPNFRTGICNRQSPNWETDQNTKCFFHCRLSLRCVDHLLVLALSRSLGVQVTQVHFRRKGRQATSNFIRLCHQYRHLPAAQWAPPFIEQFVVALRPFDEKPENMVNILRLAF